MDGEGSLVHTEVGKWKDNVTTGNRSVLVRTTYMTTRGVNLQSSRQVDPPCHPSQGGTGDCGPASPVRVRVSFSQTQNEKSTRSVNFFASNSLMSREPEDVHDPWISILVSTRDENSLTTGPPRDNRSSLGLR